MKRFVCCALILLAAMVLGLPGGSSAKCEGLEHYKKFISGITFIYMRDSRANVCYALAFRGGRLLSGPNAVLCSDVWHLLINRGEEDARTRRDPPEPPKRKEPFKAPTEFSIGNWMTIWP